MSYQGETKCVPATSLTYFRLKKEGTFDSPGLRPRGPFISASTVPTPRVIKVAQYSRTKAASVDRGVNTAVCVKESPVTRIPCTVTIKTVLGKPGAYQAER